HLSVAAGVGAIVALIIVARPLLFASLDPEVAAARGVPVRLLGVVFLVLTAITVAETVPAVGALLVFALMVTPAAIAQRLVTRPFHALTLSVALALAITWVGLTLGYYVAVPISFIISALATVAYLTVLLWQRGARAHVAHREARRRVVPSS
ncbi:MAG TPA: metal ABC transporter permease, partial [Chloroflexota bacterium]